MPTLRTYIFLWKAFVLPKKESPTPTSGTTSFRCSYYSVGLHEDIKYDVPILPGQFHQHISHAFQLGLGGYVIFMARIMETEISSTSFQLTPKSAAETGVRLQSLHLACQNKKQQQLAVFSITANHFLQIAFHEENKEMMSTHKVNCTRCYRGWGEEVLS